jgi:hypothetical protein
MMSDGTADSVRRQTVGQSINVYKDMGETGHGCLVLHKARHGAFYSRRSIYKTSILQKDG